MGTTAERKQRVDWIMSRLETFHNQRPKERVDKEKIIALMAYRTGCSERTCLDIIGMLERAGKLTTNKTEIWIDAKKGTSKEFII